MQNETAANGGRKRKPVKKISLEGPAVNSGPVKPKTKRTLKKNLPLVSIHKYCVVFMVLASGFAELANVVVRRV